MSSFQEILEIANNLVPRISPNEAKAKQDTGALIIDIRAVSYTHLTLPTTTIV